VQISVGKSENGKIKAATLCTHLTQLGLAIDRLVTDRNTGERTGSRLLRGKLFSDLKSQVRSRTSIKSSIFCAYIHTILVILANKLARREELKTYIDVEDFQLIIEQALQDTKLVGRASAIQRITITIICCTTGLRPSSLGPPHETYESHGKVRIPPALPLGCLY